MSMACSKNMLWSNAGGRFRCHFFRSLPLSAACQDRWTRCRFPSTLRLKHFTDSLSRTFIIYLDLFKALYFCLHDLLLTLRRDLNQTRAQARRDAAEAY
jgi:hypothetical protein